MRNWLLRAGMALITFSLGVGVGAVWLRQQPKPVRAESPSGAKEELEWQLTPNLVSRSLSTRSIPTRNLKRNSPDDVVWRWLKQSISEYQSAPGYDERSAILPLADEHKYSVELSVLTDDDLKNWNEYLRRENLPPLSPGRRYARLSVFLDDWICPNWGGVIDLDEPRLVHFHGSGG